MFTPRTPRTAVLGLTVGALVAGGLAVTPAAFAATGDARITEIHYDDAGADADEAIEVTAPSSADLSGLSVVLYNGNGGTSYGSLPVPASSSGIAVVTATGMQNGAPDGVALVGPAGVIEFMSYEGSFTAVGGPADGLTSTDIGVAEDGVPEGQSLQRTSGTDTWFGPTTATFGAPNDGGGTTPDPRSCAEGTIPIGDVQGESADSPCVGEEVTVGGTVVGDLQDNGFSGFFVQDAGDAKSTTSDGVFIFSSFPVALGDRVSVTGTVSEYNGLTEVTQAIVTRDGSGRLPAATTLPLPSTDAQREAFEGMLVGPASDLTVTEVYNLNRYGEIQLAQGGRLITPTEVVEPGTPALAEAAANAERSLLLDDGVTANLSTSGQAPPFLTLDDPVRVGDTAQLEPVVLSYAFNAWRLEPADGTAEGTTFNATNPRPATPDAVGGDLRIADFNVLNYFVDFPSEFGDQARGATNAQELAEQQAKIVTAIIALDADVVTLHEIENSAVLTPETPYRAVETLVTALNKAQGPNTWRYVKAHEASDVITNAIIYRVSAAKPVGEPMKPEEGEVWDNAREPIAQTFRSRGEVFTIIANHLKSKGSGTGANADKGDGQGASNADRVAQAGALVTFVGAVVEATDDPDVLLTGDFNSYRMEDPIDVITDAGFQEIYTADEYSYVFDGGSGSLDHVFATPSMAAKITGHTIWDINAVESFAYEYDGYEGLYAPYAYRASDHNPTVIGVDTKAGTPAAGHGGR